eukprot:Gb_12763 [translate_table: standard]
MTFAFFRFNLDSALDLSIEARSAWDEELVVLFYYFDEVAIVVTKTGNFSVHCGSRGSRSHISSIRKPANSKLGDVTCLSLSLSLSLSPNPYPPDDRSVDIIPIEALESLKCGEMHLQLCFVNVYLKMHFWVTTGRKAEKMFQNGDNHTLLESISKRTRQLRKGGYERLSDGCISM